MGTAVEEATWACIAEMRRTTGHYVYSLNRRTERYIAALAEMVIRGDQKAVPPSAHHTINSRSVAHAISRIAATKPDLLAFGDMHPNALTRDLITQCVPLLKRLGIKTFLVEELESNVRRVKNATTPAELADAVSELGGGQDRTAYAHLIRSLESAGIKVIGVEASPSYIRRFKGPEREGLLLNAIAPILEQHSPGEVACLFGRHHLSKEVQVLRPDDGDSFFEKSFTYMLEQSGKSVAAIHITGGFLPPEPFDNLPLEAAASGFYGYEYGHDYGVHIPEYIPNDECGISRTHQEWFHGTDLVNIDNNAFTYAVNAVLDNEPGAMSYLANLVGMYGSPGFAAIFYNAARQAGDRNAELAFERSWRYAAPEVQAMMTEQGLVSAVPSRGALSTP